MSNLYISTDPATYRVDLCNTLCGRLGCKIYHYVPVECEDAVLEAATFEPNRLPVGRLLGKSYAKGLKGLLDRERPEWIMVQEYSLITLRLLCLRRRYGYKVVAMSDDSLDMIRGNDFSWTHRLARRVVPRYLDEIVLHSPDVCDWYRAHFGKGLFLPILADERRFRHELERALPLAADLRPGPKPVVAFVGRLVGLKNIPVLVRAFEPFKERARLVIIGDGPEMGALKEMAPYALFTKALYGDCLRAWYNLIDILVIPSMREAYGAVTGEALMAGAKVVVSRKAGSSSLVREGVNGYLVNPMDPNDISRRIGDLLDTLSSGRPLCLRGSLLPFRFEDCIDNLIDYLS